MTRAGSGLNKKGEIKSGVKCDRRSANVTGSQQVYAT